MTIRDKAFKSKLGQMVRFMKDPALADKKHMLLSFMMDLHDNCPNHTTLLESRVEGNDLILKLRVRQVLSDTASELFTTANLVTQFEEDLLHVCVTYYLSNSDETYKRVMRYGSIVTDILCALAFSDAITPEIVGLCEEGLTATLCNQPLSQEWLEKISSSGVAEGSRTQDRFTHYVKTLALAKVTEMLPVLQVSNHPSIKEFSVSVLNSQHLVPARHYPRSLIQQIFAVITLMKSNQLLGAAESLEVRESIRALTATHHPKYKGQNHA